MTTASMSPQALRVALDDGTKPRDIVMALAYEAGDTLQKIGNRHGLTRERVRQVITPLTGGNRRSGPNRVPAQRHRLRLEELWAQGLTAHQIAPALGLTPKTIGALITQGRQAGWTLPYRYAKTRREAAKGVSK